MGQQLAGSVLQVPIGNWFADPYPEHSMNEQCGGDMRRNAMPCWIGEDGHHVRLERIPLASREFPEEFLQEILHRTPELLPVDELDSSFGPLVSLGREIDGIDNLFIAPNGWLTLVETKLWRNPESTRQVVAQILDYASRLAGMSFADFEALCRTAKPPSPVGSQSLFQFISGKFNGMAPPEQEFIDSVSKSLRTGRFLLLIVGDGIREGLENIMGVLHSHPQMHFTFGLVELQIYTHSKTPAGRLIIPQVVANTVEIVRATVRVETTGHANVAVAFEPPPEPGSLSTRRGQLSEKEFYQQVPDNQIIKQMIKRIFDWCTEKEVFRQWRASSVSIRLPDPRGSRQMFTLFVVKTSGDIYTGWLHEQLKTAGYDPHLLHSYISRLLSLFPGVKLKPKSPDTFAQDISAEQVAANLDDFLEVVGDFIDDIIREATK